LREKIELTVKNNTPKIKFFISLTQMRGLPLLDKKENLVGRERFLKKLKILCNLSNKSAWGF